ncbi:MAG: methyltransferase domain-containing protein [Pseudomonadota bacterium]|nr:methyltransferase domain-containing protein [Pseudomonadota bacterium]
MSEIELHRKLLGDAPRNAAFHQALKQLVVPGESTVLDIGAGTGFLSFLARKLGARQCTLIEYTDMLDMAENLARCNGIDGLRFIKAHSGEYQRKLAADIVVTETLGNFALEEGFLETAIDARRFLKPGGAILPYALRQFAAPVLTDRLQREIDIWPGVGFDLDLSVARTVSLNNMYVKTITPTDLGGSAATARLWDDLDVSPGRPAPRSRRTQAVTWKAKDLPSSLISGFALWWEADLLPGVQLSTSPFEIATHWEQIYLPLLDPLQIEANDTLELTLTCDTRPDVGVRLGWNTRQLRGGKAIQTQQQDSFRGRI